MSIYSNKQAVSNRMLKFLVLAILCFLIYLPHTAAAYSTSFDFGEVAVGTTAITTVTIRNEEAVTVTVTGAGFLPYGCFDFSIVSRTESIPIPAGQSLGIDVNYSPLDVGDCSNLLRIWTDFSPIPNTVAFSGSAIAKPDNPEDKIKEILNFLDTHMRGMGSGKSAENRFNALHNMIEIAAVQIKKGQTEAAWQKLSEIYKKLDGISRPKDFIGEGSTLGKDEASIRGAYATDTLAELIQNLMALLKSGTIKTGKVIGPRSTL